MILYVRWFECGVSDTNSTATHAHVRVNSERRAVHEGVGSSETQEDSERENHMTMCYNIDTDSSRVFRCVLTTPNREK